MQRERSALKIVMHPAVFIGSWLVLGELFALQEWIYLLRWGYHLHAVIFFESWGAEFLIWGMLFWTLWRLFRDRIETANLVSILTQVLPVSLVVSLFKEMVVVLLFPNLPFNRPHMAYGKRLEFYLASEYFDSLVIFWCVFFLLRGVGYYERFRMHESAAIRLETQLANAKLSALRMQLNPHFLFNAMNSISSLMRTNVEAADTMLEQLSSLLRMSLERGDMQLIPLREELDFIEVYLSMQDQRYAGRVKREVRIEAEVYDALVPTMILQPIVENAYAHGLSKLERDGEIEIEARRESDQLHLRVRNTGLGLLGKPDSRSNGRGVGLKNVSTRLRLHYGELGKMKITQVDPFRVEVAVVLPFRVSETAETGITRFGAE